MVAEWKYKEVEDIANKVSEHRVVGLVSIVGIPSRQFQQIRRNIGKGLDIKITRNRLMRRAFEKSNINAFGSHIQGPCGLIFTNQNPFKLRKLLEANKVAAAPRAGSIAPKDIVVPAGDTPFAPGPVIGELQKAGVKAQIKGGKIVVTENSRVAKEGDIISEDLASVLARMDIKVTEIGMDLIGAYEKIEGEEDIIYSADSLIIDESKFRGDIQSAYQGAFNLAFNARIYNSEVIVSLIQNAVFGARNLAVNAGVLNKETIPLLLSKAHVQMISLASRIPDGCDDELKGVIGSAEKAKVKANKVEKKEEKPEEEKPREEEKKDEEEAAAGLAGLFG